LRTDESPTGVKHHDLSVLITAVSLQPRSARLAELSIERGDKLLDEEDADIPGIERSIREGQE
jgi:hypothetical protein